MKLYIYKNRIYHECKYLNSTNPYSLYSFKYKIRSGEVKCPYCSFIAPGFLFIGKVIFLDSGMIPPVLLTVLPEGGKWLEL